MKRKASIMKFEMYLMFVSFQHRIGQIRLIYQKKLLTYTNY